MASVLQAYFFELTVDCRPNAEVVVLCSHDSNAAVAVIQIS